MPVYWSFLVLSILIMIFNGSFEKEQVCIEGIYTNKINKILFTIFSVYFLLFVSLRDFVQDTYAYVASYNNCPDSIFDILSYVGSTVTGKGFSALQVIFKSFVTDSHYIWFLFLAILSCWCLFKIIDKYSIDFPFSLFLFIAGTSFTWLINGTRQFLAVCILFLFTDWLLEGKKRNYIILAIVLSYIHNSAIFIAFIPLFVSSENIFTKKLFLFISIAICGTIFADSFLQVVSTLTDKNYTDAIANAPGQKFMRALVVSVPSILTLLFYQNIKDKLTPAIVLAINMSIIGTCFSLASVFTSGILVGRMPIYFTIYNLYLLPWLLKNCFSNELLCSLLKISCIICYLVFFYVQMVIAWGGLEYVSYILGIVY